MRHALWMVAVLLSATLAAGARDLPSPASRPAEPAADLLRRVGEYGADNALLTVYESGGRLFADGDGLRQVPLRRLTENRFVTDGGGRARATLTWSAARDGTAVVLAGAAAVTKARLPHRDVGGELVRSIRAGVRSDVAALRAAALRAAPPREPPPARADDLVDLAGVDASIKFDIRYATANNFMGFALYERPAAYLQRPAAEALGRVARALAPLGYGLLIHDAYRPWYVTKMFWDATPEAAHVFVADPAVGSRHNRGCAVDLTLYDLASGAPVQMTGRYDEMSRRSFADYVGGTSRERWLRALLRLAMEQQGFAVYPQEWWHFDHQDWPDYAIGNVPFDRLAAAPPRRTPPHSG